MIRKYSWMGAKLTYRIFIIGSAAFFMAASAHNMLNSLLSAQPAPCGKSASVLPEAKAGN